MFRAQNLPVVSVIADATNITIFCIGVFMTRLIQLTQGKQAMVSDVEYDLLVSADPWFAAKRRNSYYACNAKHGLMHEWHLNFAKSLCGKVIWT
jgi:hypothetical protein